MKRNSVIITASAFIFIMFFCNPNKAQNSLDQKDQMKPIPAEVKTILDRSCTGCHSEEGRALAKMKVNFTKWDEYPAVQTHETDDRLLTINTGISFSSEE